MGVWVKLQLYFGADNAVSRVSAVFRAVLGVFSLCGVGSGAGEIGFDKAIVDLVCGATVGEFADFAAYNVGRDEVAAVLHYVSGIDRWILVGCVWYDFCSTASGGNTNVL